ncbi:putative sporulation-specific glycosylase YdhD [compost metagenome]
MNGAAVKLAVAPQNVRGTTMIPLSFFGQQFGAGVSWNQATKTVSITSPKKDLYTLGFYAQGAYSEVSLIPDFDAVAFGWSRIDRSGQYTTSGPEFRWPQAAGDVTPESIVQNAASGGTAPYLMVYSGDKELELTKNVEDLQLQQQTIAGIVDTAAQKGFKGIALDLEGLGMTGDKTVVQSQYNTFVKNLSAKAKAASLKLTVILHPLNSSYKGYDYKTLASIADDLVIMAYAYEGETGPEPMNKVDEAIRLALQQVSKDKLILGISVYSENKTSVNAKIGLAKRYGLKGIAIWRLGLIGQPVWSEMGQSVEL